MACPLFSIPNDYECISDEGVAVRVKTQTRYASTEKRVQVLHDPCSSSSSKSDEGVALFCDSIWPGAVALSDYLCGSSDLVKGRTVLELGAGASLPSLVCLALGCAAIAITDYDGDQVIENIKQLVVANGFDTPRVVVIPYRWGDCPDALLSFLHGHKYQVIIMAGSLTYNIYRTDKYMSEVITSTCHPKFHGRAALERHPCESSPAAADTEAGAVRSIIVCPMCSSSILATHHRLFLLTKACATFLSSIDRVKHTLLTWTWSSSRQLPLSSRSSCSSCRIRAGRDM